ncbi:MAG: type II CAAX endopeptidase family protein [Caulobacteraceae bacterium]|nr:type II CAAX endopeptidase family protein [Caulobacteraceae bacterium]
MTSPAETPSSATFLAFAQRGRNSWWRYVLGMVLGLVFGVVLAVAVLTPLTMLHWLPPNFGTLMLHPSEPVTFFLANGAMFGVIAIGYYGAIALLHHKRFTDLLGAWHWRGYAAGFGIWIAALSVIALIDFTLAPKAFSFTGSSHTPAVLGAALAGLAVQTFTEELVFRGYLTQGLLLATRNPLAASVISGLLFGSIHIPNGLPQAVNAVAFGVVMSLIAIRTGGLAFGCGLHLANNLFGAVAVVSASDVFKGSPGLFTQNAPHLMWWDLVITTIGLGLMAILAFRARRGGV